jgi:hypothetical protein
MQVGEYNGEPKRMESKKKTEEFNLIRTSLYGLTTIGLIVGLLGSYGYLSRTEFIKNLIFGIPKVGSIEDCNGENSNIMVQSGTFNVLALNNQPNSNSSTRWEVPGNALWLPDRVNSEVFRLALKTEDEILYTRTFSAHNYSRLGHYASTMRVGSIMCIYGTAFEVDNILDYRRDTLLEENPTLMQETLLLSPSQDINMDGSPYFLMHTSFQDENRSIIYRLLPVEVEEN